MISEKFLNVSNKETSTKLNAMISKVDRFRLGHGRFRYGEGVACSKRIAFEIELKLRIACIKCSFFIGRYFDNMTDEICRYINNMIAS